MNFGGQTTILDNYASCATKASCEQRAAQVRSESQFFLVRAMESHFFAKERDEMNARIVEKCK